MRLSVRPGPEQAAWAAALQEQQRQEAEQRAAEGQQLHPQLPQAQHQQPHASMMRSLDQQPRHLEHHLVQHLQDSDAVSPPHPFHTPRTDAFRACFALCVTTPAASRLA